MIWLWLVAKWPFATRRNKLLFLVGSFTMLIIETALLFSGSSGRPSNAKSTASLRCSFTFSYPYCIEKRPCAQGTKRLKYLGCFTA